MTRHLEEISPMITSITLFSSSAWQSPAKIDSCHLARQFAEKFNCQPLPLMPSREWVQEEKKRTSKTQRGAVRNINKIKTFFKSNVTGAGPLVLFNWI